MNDLKQIYNMNYPQCNEYDDPLNFELTNFKHNSF